MTLLPEHAAAIRAALPSRDRRPIWEVANGRYGMDRTRPAGERWQLSRTPWLRGVLDAFQSDETREIILMAGSQCAKTSPMLIALAWSVKHAPAPTLWITGDDNLAKDASMERITPTLERCPDAAPLLLNNRLDKTTWKIRLRTCTVDIAGAQSSTVLEQNPYRLIFGDEVRQWPAGSLQKVEKRQRSYQEAKRCFFSTPANKGDEFHERFLAGTQETWHYPCQACGEFQPMRWVNLKRDPLGLECEKCKHLHLDAPAVRRHICEAGRWQAGNATPHARVRSFHWNAILVPWVQWADLHAEWARANDLLKLGNVEPLKVFICETLGEPWEEQEFSATKEIATSPYTFAAALPDRWDFRFFTIDVQMDELWGAVRDWKRDGSSRLVWCGKMDTWGEARAMQARVAAKDWDTFVDSGFNSHTVYAKALEFGWVTLKGSPLENFTHTKAGKTKKRLYSEKVPIDTGIGTVHQGNPRGIIPLYHWSNPAAKDILDRLRSGRGATWAVPQEIPDFYAKHMSGEVKKESRDKRTGAVKWEWVKVRKDQHLWDCEAMQIVAASMERILTGEASEAK